MTTTNTEGDFNTPDPEQKRLQIKSDKELALSIRAAAQEKENRIVRRQIEADASLAVIVTAAEQEKQAKRPCEQFRVDRAFAGVVQERHDQQYQVAGSAAEGGMRRLEVKACEQRRIELERLREVRFGGKGGAK